jgi:hypothetical protein
MSIFEVNLPDYRSAGGDPEVKRSILFKALILTASEFVKVFDIGMEVVACALAYIERVFDLNEEWV